MRIENKFKLNELKQYILQKAKYQKVIVCVDETSDLKLIEMLKSSIEHKAVVLRYVYNSKTIKDFNNMLNDGVRLVVYNISTEHFCRLDSNNNYVLNIFIPTSNYILPYLLNMECVYGDNVLLYQNLRLDYAGVIQLYYAGLNKVWADLQMGEKIDLDIFKRIDNLINNPTNFYSEMLQCVNELNGYVDNQYIYLEEREVPYNIYLKTCAIFNMLEKFNNNEENYIDFYKTASSTEEISKAHKLITKYELIDLIKYYSSNLIRLNYAILNRIKILIKKYFNFKNINLNKINNNIKNLAKSLKIDNLLYISYIFNSI